MVAIVLVSVKGSPGVTTASAALAATSVGAEGLASPVPGATGALLAELDPSGGSVQVLTASPATWGVVDAAGRLRRHAGPEAVRDHLTVVPPGVAALTAPPAGFVAESVIAEGGARWLTSLRAAAPEVVVDAGRWAPAQRTADRIRGADVVALVCRPTVSGVETARLALDRLRSAARSPVAVVVVGRKPYGADEIAQHLDTPVAGVLAWDPRAVAALWTNGVTRRWLRTPLARSAAGARSALVSLALRRQALAGDRPPAGAAPSSTGSGRRLPPPPGARPAAPPTEVAP